MLLLQRYQSESIRVGQDIKIRILEIGTNQVKIGIEAPDDVNIVREELVKQK